MGTEMAVVSKMFCSSKEVVLEVRTRPHVIAGGGGFVVTDVRSQQVMFRVDGCGVVGKKDHITVTHAATQTPLLLIRRRKGGIVEALSLYKEWGGYEGGIGSSLSLSEKKKKKKLVFTLKDPKVVGPCLGRVPISVSLTEQKMMNCSSNWFEIKGNFPDRECSVVDCAGNMIAQVGVGVGVKKKDVYQVVVKPGIDQAFVVGVIAILDYIHNGSTRC